MLHMVCGKIAAGKSTLCARLAQAPGAILIAEDHWTSKLFGDEMATVDDYIRVSARLREAIGPHIVDLLKLGLTVVLDFPANTVARRAWMRSLIEAAGADHRLHVLEAPDEVCKARLAARNAAGDHPFAASEADYEEITRYFVPPGPDEGFEVVTYRP